MLKLKYTFTAKQPICTFDDNAQGQERKLRREKILLAEPKTFLSKFASEEDRRKAIIFIFDCIFKELDTQNWDKGRLMGVWDEFTSKIFNASKVRTKFDFLNKICESFDIRSISNIELAECLDCFSDEEFLLTIRNELQYLILRFRAEKEKRKQEAKENKEQKSLFEKPQEDDFKLDLSFVKNFEYVPFIAGNSIRGLLRRLVMRDFTEQVGIKQLDKSVYHLLFTGGTLSESSGTEDIELKEKYISSCPMLGLFGSAIGRQIMEGALKVAPAKVQCLENGSGTVSFWELIQSGFGTRQDSSKQEKEIDIVAKGGEGANQMIYWNEEFISGTKFNHGFCVDSSKSLIISAFWRMIEVYKEHAHICGKSAAGHGEIEIDIEVPEGASKEYLDYLSDNKEEILKFFEVKA